MEPFSEVHEPWHLALGLVERYVTILAVRLGGLTPGMHHRPASQISYAPIVESYERFVQVWYGAVRRKGGGRLLQSRGLWGRNEGHLFAPPPPPQGRGTLRPFLHCLRLCVHGPCKPPGALLYGTAGLPCAVVERRLPRDRQQSRGREVPEKPDIMRGFATPPPGGGGVKSG